MLPCGSGNLSFLMNISAVLLAGGESRRMGKDKATLLFRGRPLWEIQFDLLRTLQPEEIFVSARTDPRWRPSGVQFVSDEPPSRGPLSGLSATLARISTDHLLALAIDMPLMNENYLRLICNLVEPGRGVLPMIGNRAEPLVAIYPKGARIEFTAALSGSDFSLQSLTKELVETGKLNVVNVLEEEGKFFRNFNDFGDFAQPVGTS
jgi:molybdopterin-guanine dinucleotide biosynthesis protein A